MAIPGNMLSSVTEMVDPNTSGWTAKTNCVISLGTGGRNGNGCLTVKSNSSGEMQARTVSSYPVTAGNVYQTFADASGATVAERIGIRWLTSGNSEISVTWSLVTATASATWHRIGVAGTAPSGATRAQVVVSSSPLAGAVSSFFENVYFGLPVRTTGNLLGFGTESLEIDTSGWVTELNCSLTRQAPMVQWPVDFYLAGGEVLALTVTANGNAAARTVDRPAVTPGVEYQAYAYLNPPTSGSATWIELRFYNAANTQIQATRSALAAPGTGYYRQRVSDVAPPLAVACGVAFGIDTGTAAQVLRVENIVVATATRTMAGSVVPYLDASFEQGVGTWTKTSGVATLARSTPWGTFSSDGSYSLTVTSTTATASVIRSGKYPVTALFANGFRLQYAEDVTAGGWTLTRGVRWYDAANTDLGLTALSASAAPTPGWWYLVYDGVAPAGATQAAVELTLTATATNSVIRLDAVSLWQTLALSAAAVTASTASITLTLRELDLDFLLRVYRVTESGTRTLVRGPSGLYDGTLITTDTLVIEDYEAPLGVPVSYYIEIIDPFDQSVSSRTTETVTIPHDDINVAWIKDPGDPQRNSVVLVEKPPDWARPIDQASYVVKGRRNKIVHSGKRQGLEGDLVIWTRSDDERAALNWLLDSGHVLLWQAAPGMGVADMYVNIAQSGEARIGGTAMEPWRTWTLPLIEADMPVTTGISGSAGRTWQDISSEFDTFGELLAPFGTWEDVFLDRRG
jgi:hypothetical protein